MAVGERFWDSVDRTGQCWPWMRARKSDGYGSLSVDGQSKMAHRVAWELTNGPIPEGMAVLHRCDNPPCCNPTHLFLGTWCDNNQDRARKGRSATGDRHGTHTHPERHRGETRHTAKLTEAQVRHIRTLKGTPPGHIAEQYGVSRRAIRSVLSGETWGWLS